MTTADLDSLMAKIISNPNRYRLLKGALASCAASVKKIQALAQESVDEMAKLKELTTQIDDFIAAEEVEFEADQPLATAAEAGLKVPMTLDAQKLPAIPPKQNYQKIVAILEASANPEGITVEEIVRTWRDLGWRHAQSPNLLGIARDAIKTAQRVRLDVAHTGGRNGRYRIVPCSEEDAPDHRPK
jgi:hypothetical protein